MNASWVTSGFEIGAVCDVGRKRRGRPNQDTIKIVAPEGNETFPPLLIVADGMGGYRGGETASKLVAETIARAYKETQPSERFPEHLQQYIRQAHQAVRERAARQSELGSMGSTVALALLTPEKIYVANVGDSRVYLLRGKRIIRLSQDQSWVAAQVRAGLITEQEARRHPKRNRLTMSISAKRPTVEVYTSESAFGAEDILVLCSDGLWGVVAETLIQAVAFELPPQEAAQKLAALANAGQGPDNISVIVARREGAVLQSIFAGEEDETNPGF